MFLLKLAAKLDGEVENPERAFLGEEPLSVLEELRFRDLEVDSGMNRLSASRCCRVSKRRVNSLAPSSASKSSSR
jgi:hypothetical protein